jgi:hypothetical protein
LSFDYRDITVSQTDLVAGIDGGSVADSRSIDQIPIRYIGSVPDGGVEVTCDVAKERIESDAGVGDARGVANERLASAGGVEAARGVANERIESAGGIGGARGVTKERLASAGGVLVARRVASECTDSAGGVEVARGVAKERSDSAGGIVGARAVAKECIDSAGSVRAARSVNCSSRYGKMTCCIMLRSFSSAGVKVGSILRETPRGIRLRKQKTSRKIDCLRGAEFRCVGSNSRRQTAERK